MPLKGKSFGGSGKCLLPLSLDLTSLGNPGAAWTQPLWPSRDLPCLAAGSHVHAKSPRVAWGERMRR